MIHHPELIQGSQEWLRARMGRPTASEFHRIITSTGKPSDARFRYIGDILAALIFDRPLETVTTPAMMRGSELEAEAVAYYEFMYDTKTEVAGFCTTDDGLVGASPDRFSGERRLLEVKVPDKPGIQMMYVCFPNRLVDEYNIQVQGQLWVCRDREAVDILAYHRGLPEVVVSIERDPKIQDALDAALPAFCAILGEKVAALKERGFIADKPAGAPRQYREWLTEEDVEAIIADRFGQDSLGG